MGDAEEFVCVVDDDPSVRRGLTRLLHSAGYTVEAFCSATDFLGQERCESVGCLVLDVRMPGLDGMELQAELGGETFEVLTIATGRNSPEGIRKFFAEIGVDNLPRHQDPKQALASQMGIFGLPISVILDAEGREIARLRGDADWSSDSAKAVFKALLPQG